MLTKLDLFFVFLPFLFTIIMCVLWAFGIVEPH